MVSNSSRAVAAYLVDIADELSAAERLIVDPPSRFAAFHLQQAAEKLVKAVRLYRGIYASTDHNIVRLIDGLPEKDIWRERLSILEDLSAYATAYRYPSASGNTNPGPSAGELLQHYTVIRSLLELAESELV